MNESSPDKLIEQARTAVAAALTESSSVDLSWIQPPPADDGWTLASDALRFIMAVARQLKPRHILEFGSGLSSRVLAHACAGLRPACAISSVDHDPEFGPLAAKEFAEKGGVGRVRFQIAPVVARDCGGKILPLYHLRPDRFASQRPVDLVLIDGPPVNLGGREGTLYQAMEFARPGTLLLLDDASRAKERAILSCWQESLGDAVEVKRLPGFTRGLAAIIVRRVVRRAELWAHRQRLTTHDLEAVTPPGVAVILVDLNCWGSDLAPGRRCLPFLERDGEYWGAPADDATAIGELERVRGGGADFLALVWPAFWWRDCYPGFFQHLHARYQRIVHNDRLVVFDLRKEIGR